MYLVQRLTIDSGTRLSEPRLRPTFGLTAGLRVARGTARAAIRRATMVVVGYTFMVCRVGRSNGYGDE